MNIRNRIPKFRQFYKIVSDANKHLILSLANRTRDPRANNQINTIIRDPERYGITKSEMEAEYCPHGERMGIEGEARNLIPLSIINDGWIRL